MESPAQIELLEDQGLGNLMDPWLRWLRIKNDGGHFYENMMFYGYFLDTDGGHFYEKMMFWILFDSSKIDTLWFSIAAAISDCSAVSNLQSRITAALWFSMAFLRIFFGAGWYLYGPSGQRISQALVLNIKYVPISCPPRKFWGLVLRLYWPSGYKVI